MNIQTQTVVTLSADEYQTLLDLAKLAAMRLTFAEATYYNALLSRLGAEIEAQIKDMQNQSPAGSDVAP